MKKVRKFVAALVGAGVITAAVAMVPTHWRPLAAAIGGLLTAWAVYQVPNEQ